ncbi:MAG: glycosyltransferase [Cyclobacteriaceae bacterium]
MGIAFVSVMLAYAVALLFLTRKWLELPQSFHEEVQEHLRITVVIPVRNEAESIIALLSAIENQNYPIEAFEVIVVDDQSTDDTFDLVEAFKNQSPLDIQLLSSDPTQGSPKKQAIELAVNASKGEIILTTDGDCTVGTDWLDSINQAFKEEDTQLVMGPVAYEIRSLADRLQWVEFSALQAVSATLLSLGVPSMGNGANLAYRKSAFLKVDGFAGNLDVASGDDEFLVRKMARHYGVKSLQYLKSTTAIVSTLPAQGIATIINQKIRWSSKWKHQPGTAPWLFPVVILLLNMMPLLTLIAYAYSIVELEEVVSGWVLKALGDMAIAQSSATFYDREHKWRDLILAEIIYPLYVLFFGIASIFGKYTWKDRKYNE